MFNLSVNFYHVLGVDRSATDDAIKTAFRGLAKRYHPDVCKEPNAEEKFKEINTAYMTLGDPVKRKDYNDMLDMAAGKPVDMGAILRDFGVRPPPPPKRRRQRHRRGQADVEEIPDGFLRDGSQRDPFFDDSCGGIF